MDKKTDNRIYWNDIEFFNKSDINFELLEKHLSLQSYGPNQKLIETNVTNKKLYIISEGEFTVNKNDLVLITLRKNQVFGEISSLLGLPTNADIYSKENSKAFELNLEDLQKDEASKKLLSDLKDLALKEVAFKLNISNQGYALKLKKENDDLKEKRRYSILFTQIFTFISLYTFCLDIIRRFEHQLPSNTIISGAIIFLFAILLLYLIIKSKMPLESYGITFDNLKSNILQSFLYTIPLLVIIFLIKYFWVITDTTGTIKLFQPEAIFSKPELFNFKFYILAIVAYCILSILQEFIGRCGIHATLRNFYLSDENPSEWKGIIVSSILFMATHAHLGAAFSALVFLPGVFWAWLFTKQNSIVGPAFSHCITGVFAVFVLGFPI